MKLTASARTKGLLRRQAVRLLQVTRLNTVASDLYYRHLHGFRPASTGLDEGFETIFERAAELGSFEAAPVYCEFGVYKGETINFIASKIPHTVHGFDSFEGLPEVWRAAERLSGRRLDPLALPILDRLERGR